MQQLCKIRNFFLCRSWVDHEVNQEIIKFIDTIVAECGKEKHDYEHHIVDPEMYDDMVAFITPEAMEEAVFTDDKQTREANIRAI